MLREEGENVDGPTSEWDEWLSKPNLPQPTLAAPPKPNTTKTDLLDYMYSKSAMCHDKRSGVSIVSTKTKYIKTRFEEEVYDSIHNILHESYSCTGTPFTENPIMEALSFCPKERFEAAISAIAMLVTHPNSAGHFYFQDIGDEIWSFQNSAGRLRHAIERMEQSSSWLWPNMNRWSDVCISKDLVKQVENMVDVFKSKTTLNPAIMN